MKLLLTYRRMLLGLGLFLAHTPVTQPMDRSTKIFHKACTVIGYGIQAMPVASGLCGLGTIAKAKYIDSPEIANKLQAEANLQYPEAVAFVRETAKVRGVARFNDANHYNGLLIRRTDHPSVYWARNLSVGKQGQLLFNHDTEDIVKGGNQEAQDTARAFINHELQHKDDADVELLTCAQTSLPFVVECATRKIKAPIKAFALAKNMVSSEPSCLKSVAKIPGAMAKFWVSGVAFCAISQSIERKADNRGIPDNIEQLDGFSNHMEGQSLSQLGLTPMEKLAIDPVHPTFAERAKTARDRADALVAKQQINQANNKG